VRRRQSRQKGEALAYGVALAISFLDLFCASRVFAQITPGSPDRPWHSPWEEGIAVDTKNLHKYGFSIDPAKTHSLADLIDLAEAGYGSCRIPR